MYIEVSKPPFFSLFKLVTLPTRISTDIFAQYVVDHTHFGLQHCCRGYFLLADADYNRCKGNSNHPSSQRRKYDARILTCEGNFLFQGSNTQHPCRWELLLQRHKPSLRRYDRLWIYYFPSEYQISIP